jgi:5'-deoxynucleotidase YfbR-like HD superfamily hydrolase
MARVDVVRGYSSLDAGSKLVNEAGATMHDIVESVRRVTDIMGEISAASQEQTSGIDQINQQVVDQKVKFPRTEELPSNWTDFSHSAQAFRRSLLIKSKGIFRTTNMLIRTSGTD